MVEAAIAVEVEGVETAAAAEVDHRCLVATGAEVAATTAAAEAIEAGVAAADEVAAAATVGAVVAVVADAVQIEYYIMVVADAI